MIPILPLLIGAVGSMIIGSIWYGPLFGNAWMRILGMSPNDEVAKKQMQKEAMPLYGIQIALVLLQLWVLYPFLVEWVGVTHIEKVLWIWLGFIMPTIASTVLWTNKSTRTKWSQFLIQIGYQLVVFIFFALILGAWI